jgi:hypothetical protein
MQMPITGGCACGAIRYEAAVEPVMMFNCHCVRGTPRYHDSDASSGGQHRRGYCADCGSRLTGGQNPAGDSGIVGVTAGSLDDPALFRPQMDIFAAQAQPWARMDPELPKFDQMPPE